MKLSSVLAVTAAALASAQEERVRCGMDAPSDDLKALLASAVEEYSNSRASANGSSAAAGAVDTYVHIVTTEAKEGAYTQSQIDEQVRPTRMSSPIALVD